MKINVGFYTQHLKLLETPDDNNNNLFVFDIKDINLSGVFFHWLWEKLRKEDCYYYILDNKLKIYFGLR